MHNSLLQSICGNWWSKVNVIQWHTSTLPPQHSQLSSNCQDKERSQGTEHISRLSASSYVALSRRSTTYSAGWLPECKMANLNSCNLHSAHSLLLSTWLYSWRINDAERLVDAHSHGLGPDPPWISTWECLPYQTRVSRWWLLISLVLYVMKCCTFFFFKLWKKFLIGFEVIQE